MNGKPADERLSAWIDNELSLDERAEFEKLLAAQPELRQELESLSRVSYLVRSLPRQSAPVELAPSVMRAIERETLLAGDDVVVRRRRRLMRLVAGTAAGLVVATAVWFSTQDGSQVADSGSKKDGARPIVQISEPPASSFANKPQLPTAPVPVKVPADAIHSLQGRSVLHVSQGDLTAARAGDIVHAVRQQGDSLVVIRLTVIDRKADMEALQVLLSAENIAPEAASGASGVDEHIALYVQSTPEQLSRAIQELGTSLKVEALDVGAGLPIADVDPAVRSQFDGLAESRQKPVTVPEGSTLRAVAQKTGAAVAVEPAKTTEPAEPVRTVRVLFLMDEPAAKPVSNG